MKDILFPLRRLHGEVHEYFSVAWPYVKYKLRNPNAVFLVFTPEHGNLGDHAIAYAEAKILNNAGIEYMEITGAQLGYLYRKGWLHVMNGATILVNGGGNMGTLWFIAEEITRDIIRKSPKSNVLVLPNTIFYEDSEWGRKEFDNSKICYNRHKKLYLYARETLSYEIMRNAYKNVKLIPDMVLSLEQQGTKRKREGCLLCLRSDCEKTRSEEEDQIIRYQAAVLFETNVSDTDMVVKDGVSISQREAALQAKFDEFSGAELVITDRLHGMIFCAITGTPCIVVESKSPKVRGCYEWIRDLDYIRFADDVTQIAAEYRKIPKTDHIYANSHLKHYYRELADDILSKI